MTEGRTAEVVFQPEVCRGVQRGINQVVAAIRPTLGPLSRFVAVDRASGSRAPELLDNGATIARRILALPDRDADMGAMLLRHVLWQVHEKVGDGTATTAVLLQSIYDQGVRYLASGGNAMLLRQHLDEGMRVILKHLAGMTAQVQGKELLTQVAESICYDRPLAGLLGEILDIIGEYGQLDIRSGRGRSLEREYVEGMYWEAGLFSREMITDHAKLRTEMHSAAILISDLALEDPRQLLPVLEMAAGAGIRGLLVVAMELSSPVRALLLSASREPVRFQAVAVKTPGISSTGQAMAMEDLAILTGGRPLLKVAGHTLRGLRLEDLGQARRVWADHIHFGITGGRGDPRALRAHIASLRQALEGTSDKDLRQKLLKRIGKLMGGSATLWVGGATETEIRTRCELAERTAGALRGVVREGILPGSGVSLLACRPPLQERLDCSSDADEQAAYRILIRATEAPIRAILANAGYDAGKIMAEIDLSGNGHGFDVRSGRVVDMAQAGIWDAATVVSTAVHSAVSGAALALTTEVLVHRKRPPLSTEP